MVKNNKGYTLVEMLIVLAIMAILSGLAVVSVGLMRKAKIQDAITTFDSQLTNLWMMTKATASDQKSMKGTWSVDADGVYILTVADKTTTVSTTKYENWSKYVTITYNGNACEVSGFDIQFDKSTGAVVSGKGAGDYVFMDKAGKKVATVHLDAITGNHYVK